MLVPFFFLCNFWGVNASILPLDANFPTNIPFSNRNSIHLSQQRLGGKNPPITNIPFSTTMPISLWTFSKIPISGVLDHKIGLSYKFCCLLYGFLVPICTMIMSYEAFRYQSEPMFMSYVASLDTSLCLCLLHLSLPMSYLLSKCCLHPCLCHLVCSF